MIIKKIISLTIAALMIMSMACVNTFAHNEIANTENISNIISADELIALNNRPTVNTSVISMYATSNDELTHSFSCIKARSNPYSEVNTILSSPNNDFAAYRVPVCTHDYYNYEIVDQLVIVISGLSEGDFLVALVTDQDGYEVGNFAVNGNTSSSSGIVIPVNGSNSYAEYNIYVLLPTGYNTDVSYTLQIASRYIHATQQFYSSGGSINFNGYNDYSSTGYININASSVPNSAIVDSMFINGTLRNTRNGRSGYTCLVLLQNGTHEIAGTCPSIMENLTYHNIPLAGTWTIKYRPDLYTTDPHTLSNFSATIDYTYDILDV